MKQEQLAEIVATEINLMTLELWRSCADRTDLEQIRDFDGMMSQLGENIVNSLEAADALPEPDSYEEWLAEIKRFSDKLMPMELLSEIARPDISPRKDQPVPDTPKSAAIEPEKALDPAADARNQSGPEEPSPIDGDEADAGAATEQPQDNQEPSVGGSLETKTEKTIGGDVYDIKQLAIDVDTWRKEHGHKGVDMQNLIGVSGYTVSAMLRGQKVSAETVEKARTAMAGSSKPAPRPVGQIYLKKTAIPKQDLTAAGLIRGHLKQWLECQSMDAATASTVLSVSVNVLQDILEGHLPVNNIIHQLSKQIPTIRANYKYLMREAKKSAGE